MDDAELDALITDRCRSLAKMSGRKLPQKNAASTSSREEPYRPARWIRTQWATDVYSQGAYSFVPAGLSATESQGECIPSYC